MKMGRPKADNAKRKAVTVRLSESTYNRLAAHAAQRKATMTDVVRRSLEEYLARQK